MYRKILVPLDGSDLAECTLEHVRAVAVGCSVPEVVLLSVIETIRQDSSMAAELGPDLLREMDIKSEMHAAEYLNRIAADLRAKGLSVKTAFKKGQPAEEILNYAADEDVDLVVMSTHGRTGMARFAFGSVADKVSRHAVVPLLLIAVKACRLG